ncbi:MAG: exodeoxyribonuclease VII small subunit [Desulfobacterales bacterium]
MTPKTFEETLQRLEQIVRELEDGELALEESVAKFEEGMRLSRKCAKLLDETEKRIALLIETSSGEIEERKVEPENLTHGK